MNYLSKPNFIHTFTFTAVLSSFVMACGGVETDASLVQTEDRLTTKKSGAFSPKVKRVALQKWVLPVELVTKYKSKSEQFKDMKYWFHKDEKSGKKYGVRIGKVPTKSVLFDIGIRSYDVIVSVNGFEINNPSDVRTAFWKLQRAKYLVVDIERLNRPYVFEYWIK